MDCEGRDSRQRPCQQSVLTGRRLCYWHEKVATGLIEDYFDSKKSSSEFELTPVQSTPRPGGDR